jgi:HNH endonuclease/NUMOD4 motif
MKTAEIWKPVSLPDFEKDYEVSSQGRIRRVTRCKGQKDPHLLKNEVIRNGYFRVCLHNDKGRTKVLVHRLVALAFIGPIPEGLQVNHKDGDKVNNSVDNLEYVTLQENVRHRDENGLGRFLKHEEHNMAKLNWSAVRAIRRGIACGVKHTQLSVMYGVTLQTIHSIVKGKTWKDSDL